MGNKGFTLVELLIAIIIVGVMISLTFLVLNPFKQLEKAKDAQRHEDLNEITKALDTYYNDANCYPLSLSFGSTFQQGSAIYMKNVPQDPDCAGGGSCYQYLTDEGSSCPQWNVLFSKANPPDNTVGCALQSFPSNSCLPTNFYSAGYASCTISGSVDCSIISTMTIPTSGGSQIVPTPGPNPTGGPTSTPTIAPSTPTPTTGGLPPTPTPTTTVVNCPPNLATAITSTPVGGTLNISGCSYSGQFTISKSMTLKGGIITGRLFIKANDITVDGLDISGGTQGSQQGQVEDIGYDRFIFENSRSHDGGGRGITIKNSTGSQVLNSELDHMDQEGYGFPSTTNLVVKNTKIHENNLLDNYSTGFEAGGGKMVQSTNALFENNQSWGNHGPGFWEDIYNHGSVYNGNRVWQNTRAGIMIEVSYDASVENNIMWQNYYGQGRTWVQSASILSHSSTGTKILNNTIYDTDIGIGIDVQQRSDWPLIHPVQNVLVQGNYIIDCNALVAWGDDYQKELFDPTNNNKGQGNFYWKSQPEPTANRFAWNSKWWSTLSSYESAGAESGSSYISDTQKETVLNNAGIPH